MDTAKLNNNNGNNSNNDQQDPNANNNAALETKDCDKLEETDTAKLNNNDGTIVIMIMFMQMILPIWDWVKRMDK